MDDELQELRRQRELIKKHLEWLDGKIAAKEGDTSTQHDAPAVDLATDITIKQLSGASSDREETVLAAEDETEADIESFRAFSGAPKNDIQRAKMGCLIIFGCGIAVFLFLLFGLPYLIDLGE